MNFAEGVLCSEQFVVFEELSSVFTDAVELVWKVTAPPFLWEHDLFDDISLDESPEVLPDRRLVPTQIHVVVFINVGSPAGWSRIS